MAYKPLIQNQENQMTPQFWNYILGIDESVIDLYQNDEKRKIWGRK